jgi:hypothetical protein
MSARVSVGTSYTDRMLLAFVAGAALAPLLAARGAAGESVEARVALTAVGGVFAALALARLLVVVRNRRWIKPTEFGLIVTDRRGVVAYTDEMIRALGFWAEVVYSRGVARASRRTGTLVLATDDEDVSVPFRYDFPLNEPDPLGELFERVFGKLVSAAKAAIITEGSLSGDGWSLARDRLILVGPEGDVAVPVQDLAAVDVIDARVCVWRKGEAEPLARIPAVLPNALVLRDCLAAMIPPQDSAAGSADGLGRIIFERNDSIRGARLWGGSAFVIVGAVAGVGSALTGAIDQRWALAVLGLLLILATAGWGSYMWDRRVDVFRAHAHGVSRINRLGATGLWYGEIGSFSYNATRMYDDGLYAGTHLSLYFVPFDGTDLISISYNATVRNADDELERLREYISRVIAGHMFRRLEAGQPVPWTPNITFRPDGLELKNVGWFRGRTGESNVVPYREITQHSLTEGVFRLAVGGQGKWAVEEDYSQPNFFPGYVLLMTILHPPDSASPATAPAPTE